MEEKFAIRYQLYDNGKLITETRTCETFVDNGTCEDYWRFCRDFGRAIGYAEETLNTFFGEGE